MSQAFVKEPDGAEFEPLPERPVSPHPNFVTAEGLAAIERELARLDAVHADAVRANDKFTLARSERDRRYWTARRANAQRLDGPRDANRVQFGSTVTIVRADGRTQTFRIVGEDEADPARGSVSYVAPLARALIGKAVGDTVAVAGQDADIVSIG